MTPQRTCLGCRRRDDQGQMVRIVRRGDLVVDGTSPRLPGRGAYIHSTCVGLAVKRQAVRRVFGPGVDLAPELLHLAQ